MTQKRKTQVNYTEEKILDNLTDLNMKSMPDILFLVAVPP